jgi:dephospho-CoA kinase
MLRIGITGGIGCGKTTVCKIFEILEIPVYYADERAKYLMTNNKEIINKIENIFGKKSYLENGQLNRKHIAEIAFIDQHKLEILNKTIHPAVKKDFLNWVKDQEAPYIIKEAALLFETSSYKDLDLNILVTAPLNIRIQRVMMRDNTDRDSVLNRVKNQMPEEEKIKLADFIINNDGNHYLIKQVLDLDKKFKEINEEIR